MSLKASHEKCPNCAKMGQDTSGDNMYRYSDGHAYCFACAYREPATHFVPSEPQGFNLIDVLPPDLEPTLPDQNYNWLSQWLTNQEIIKNFQWSPSRRRHYYVTDGFFEGRSLLTDPKSLQTGKKPRIIMESPGVPKDTLIVVEDVVSQIKVSRHFRSYALFGATCDSEWYVWAKDQGIRYTMFWLDSDKYTKAQSHAARGRLLGGSFAALFTERDPKYHTDIQICELVNSTLQLLKAGDDSWPKKVIPKKVNLPYSDSGHI